MKQRRQPDHPVRRSRRSALFLSCWLVLLSCPAFAAAQSPALPRPAIGRPTLQTPTAQAPANPATAANPAPRLQPPAIPTPPAQSEPIQPAISRERLTAIFSGEVPTSVAELRAMEAKQQSLIQQALASTVAVQIGPAHGSGVLVSGDGYVLTASHVAGEPGRRATIVMPDGRRVKATTLGMNRNIDAGLIKIDSHPDGEGAVWPHAPIGQSGSLKVGAWCLATGHPGGWQTDRGPVARVGRVLSNSDTVIVTDCTLLGGDSGGPLFDMEGRVIGIHSRITNELTENMHVPIDGYRESWKRMVASEKWGHLPGFGPVIGVQGDPNAASAIVTGVVPGSPAAKAGVRVNDVVVDFDGAEVANFESLRSQVWLHDPGDRVTLRLRRDGEILEVNLVVGRQR